MLKVHVLDRLYRHSSNVAHGVEVPAGARLLFTGRLERATSRPRSSSSFASWIVIAAASALRRPCPIWGVRGQLDGDSNLGSSGAYLWLSPCSTMPLQEAVGM
jgi:hypothetical protein